MCSNDWEPLTSSCPSSSCSRSSCPSSQLPRPTPRDFSSTKGSRGSFYQSERAAGSGAFLDSTGKLLHTPNHPIRRDLTTHYQGSKQDSFSSQLCCTRMRPKILCGRSNSPSGGSVLAQSKCPLIQQCSKALASLSVDPAHLTKLMYMEVLCRY